MSERMAREEQDDLDRKHGQQILDLMTTRGRQGSEEDPLLDALNRAYQAKAEKADKQ
jgi:hypothetical protein